MKQKVWTAAIIVMAVVLTFLWVSLGGSSDYDLQSLALAFFRLNLLMLWVWFVIKIKEQVENDDLEEDWKRIDAGNTATAIYRGAEFVGLIIAGAMLISKV